MNHRVLIQSQGKIYDVTGLLYQEVVFSADIGGNAGKLVFSVIKDGQISFLEGDSVTFYVDEECVFRGWVMTKERDEKQIIQVTAYDQLFYLAKNKISLVYENKTATELIRMLAGEYGLACGSLSDSGWVIAQRIEEGQSLLDIILTALEITKEATGKEYFFYDLAGKLTLKERSELVQSAALRCDGTISRYWYKTDISRDTFNRVCLYQAGRKETEHLALVEEKSGDVARWGRLEYYRRMDHALNEAQLMEFAKGILAEKSRVVKQLTVENINGDIPLRAGQTVYIEITDLAEISLQAPCLIESCERRYADGVCRTKLGIRIEA